MRRSAFSKADINRIFSAIQQHQRDEYIKQLKRIENSTQKELAPYYKLISIDFDTETRNTKLEFKQFKKYRTIERYVTQNYIKYPVFSEWKTKTKIIHKSIRLTNSELENLSTHEDDLISRHATDIVYLLDDPSLYPSWFIKKMLAAQTTEKINSLKAKYEIEISSKSTQNINNEEQIKDYRKRIQDICTEIYSLNHLSETINKKINRCKRTPLSIIICVITLGLFCWFISSKRKTKLIQKLSKTQIAIECLENELKDIDQQTNERQAEISKNLSFISSHKKELDRLIKIEQDKLKVEQDSVQPLNTSYNIEQSSFVMLKHLCGLDNQKIIGCYVIHNIENNKYYVGQSKDVLRRLKQHFKGTVPHNIAFAEDYYTSQMPNKEDLFEIKIIPCLTKDELDSTEKALINKYDSFNSGYNGTQGNS